MICQICGKEYSTKGIGKHLKGHNMNNQTYYDLYIHSTSKYCKCGKTNTFLSITEGYSKHCSIKCSMNDIKTTKKREKTNIEKYGVINPFQSEEIKEKIKDTWINNYGVTNPNKNKKIRGKIEKTNLQKYGVIHPLQNNKVKQKQIMTCIEHFGYEHPNQNPNIMNKVINSKNNTIEQIELLQNCTYVKKLIDLYGSGWYQSPLDICFKQNGFLFVKNDDIDKIKLYLKCNGSYIEYYVYNKLQKYNILFIHHDRKQIKPYELDFYLQDYHIGIECNGYFHNIDCKRINRDQESYHKMKLSLCEKQQIKLVNIYDVNEFNLDTILSNVYGCEK